MPAGRYDRAMLTELAAVCVSWNDLSRRLGYRVSGGRRRSIQSAAAEYGIDTHHFKQRSPWRRYPDAAIAEAVATSVTLREVVTKLGATPATGTLSHIRRRIAAARIDTSHFPHLNRSGADVLFTREELEAAAGCSKSFRGAARTLGIPDDGRSRAALRHTCAKLGIDTSHFSHSRLSIKADELREAVASSTSYAGVMRAMGLPVEETGYRRVQRQVARLGLDTSHFKRRARRSTRVVQPRLVADEVFRTQPEGASRENRRRLRRALDEVGQPYRCEFCGNTGEWLGKAMTLQIDHVNGEWRDNRRENLRYLCPNCHATTETWCSNRRKARSGEARSGGS